MINEKPLQKNIKLLGIFSFYLVYIYQLFFYFPLNISVDKLFFLNYGAIFIHLSILIYFGIRKKIPLSLYCLYYLFFGLAIINYTRGILNMESYLDKKQALIQSGGGVGLFTLLSFILGTNINLLKNIVSKGFTFLFITAILQVIFINYKATAYTNISFNVVSVYICFYIVLIPLFPKKYIITILAITVFILVTGLDWRSNVLRIIFALSTVIFYYVSSKITKKIKFAVFFILFFTPIFYINSGLKGVNVFQKFNKNEYIIGKGESQENIFTDNRTFLYQEVLLSAINDNTLFFGKGSIGSYKTDFFVGQTVGNTSNRKNVEVGALKMLLAQGLFGVFLYGLIIFISSYIAIFKSNNTISKSIGLFLICNWIVFFIENITDFDLYYYFLWIFIGIISSNKFRSLTDIQLNNLLKT